jgi:hypothetical protein
MCFETDHSINQTHVYLSFLMPRDVWALLLEYILYVIITCSCSEKQFCSTLHILYLLRASVFFLHIHRYGAKWFLVRAVWCQFKTAKYTHIGLSIRCILWLWPSCLGKVIQSVERNDVKNDEIFFPLKLFTIAIHNDSTLRMWYR